LKISNVITIYQLFYKSHSFLGLLYFKPALYLYISRKDHREAPVICSMLTNECEACLSVASSLGARVNKCMEQIGNAVGLEGNIQQKELDKRVL